MPEEHECSVLDYGEIIMRADGIFDLLVDFLIDYVFQITRTSIFCVSISFLSLGFFISALLP